MRIKLRQLLPLVILLLLNSCATYKQAATHVSTTQHEIQHDKNKYATTAPAVVVKEGYYVDTQPVSLQQPPAWLQKNITLQANQMPFSMLMARLLRDSNVSAATDKSINSQQLVTMNYSGTVQGALDQLAAQTHYYYSLSAHQVNWSAFETRTFNISFMPGTSSYLVGQSQAGQQSLNTSGNNATKDHLNDQQYSTMQGQLSVWHDIRSTLDQMKSKQGAVFVSESTSSVTVTDYPDNLKTMSAYLKKINQTLSKQVLVKVQVLEINLNQDSNYGINWQSVANVLKHSIKFSGNLASGTNLMATNLLQKGSATTGGTIQFGDNGSLISALDQQGKVRVVTKPEVVTMNDQIASMRITQDTGYIQSVNTSRADTYISTSITPGTITDGFTLYVLPRIQGNKVYMQISSRIASLVALQKESTEPDNVASGDVKLNNQQFSAIELPTVAAKEFNQRSIIESGSTLIIAGYKRLRDQVKSAKYFGVGPLGGKGAQSDNVETLVLITPVILKSNGV